MTCEQGLLRLLWGGGGRSWSATALRRTIIAATINFWRCRQSAETCGSKLRKFRARGKNEYHPYKCRTSRNKKNQSKFVLKVLTKTYTKRDIHQKLRLSLMKISQTIETKRWQIKQNQITNGNFFATAFRFWLLAQQQKNINKSKSLYKVLLSSFVKINFQYVTPIGISKCCNGHH